MAKKFGEGNLIKRMEARMKAEEAVREEREAKAKIDWRKKLKLWPWQRLKDVELPDEFFESQLIIIEDKIDSRFLPHFKQISEIIALSNDYVPYSKDWELAMKYMYVTYLLPDGHISPLLPTVVSSMLDIAKRDAREKRTKSMREWRETMESLTEKLLPQELIKQEANPDNRGFTVRQTAIIAYALCRKGGFIPKNKKNISKLFQNLTGRSANTLSENLCTTYADEEIEKIAVAIEEYMPEFASYLREKNFYYPEIKK